MNRKSRQAFTCISRVVFLLLFPGVAFSADTEKGDKKAIPPPLIVDPQPPCQFNPDQSPEMVLIEGGTFKMGTPETEKGSSKNERPLHDVSIQPFAISRCETSVQQFQQFVDETGYQTDGEKGDGCYVVNQTKSEYEQDKSAYWKRPGFEQEGNHPVVCVSFNDALAYIAWLSLRSGQQYRLPSEAEWEYAARGSTSQRFSYGDDDGYQQLCDHGNSADQIFSEKTGIKDEQLAPCEDGYAYTAPTASYKPNPYALYDMHGNVWEWVQDCWHEGYRNAPPDGADWLAQEGGDCQKAVVRGGSWFVVPEFLRSGFRFRFFTVESNTLVGFRVARTLQ